MRSAPSLSSRRDSRPAPPGLGEMAANASQGIVGILSSALPEITRVGVRGKPSCMPLTTSQSSAEKQSVSKYSCMSGMQGIVDLRSTEARNRA